VFAFTFRYHHKQQQLNSSVGAFLSSVVFISLSRDLSLFLQFLRQTFASHLSHIPTMGILVALLVYDPRILQAGVI
jgi:cadmium resistance protein CadD (predicted permease)